MTYCHVNLAGRAGKVPYKEVFKGLQLQNQTPVLSPSKFFKLKFWFKREQ
jgi:hypothetical protein